MLKWRYTKVTPNLVKKMLAKAGFTSTTKVSWLGGVGVDFESVHMGWDLEQAHESSKLSSAGALPKGV